MEEEVERSLPAVQPSDYEGRKEAPARAKFLRSVHQATEASWDPTGETIEADTGDRTLR